MRISILLTPEQFSLCFIDGQWQASRSNRTFSVTNPADGSHIASVPDCTEEDAHDAISSADRAFQTWKSTTAKERFERLQRWCQLILEYQEPLAKLVTIECGKPIAESRSEVRYAASFVEWFSEEAKRVRGETIPEPSQDRKMLVQKQPIGVCAAITPWNFPLAMITRKCAPALAAGCTVVIKPAENTPLSALALAKLSEMAGFPKGIFNVLTAQNGADIGKVLTTHPLVKKISFTGSTQVGKTLLKQSADTVKSASMELGGNAPFIVFDDADLELSVKAALASKYRNNGQTCVCANRFIIHKSIVDKFTTELTKQTATLRVGNGLNPETQLGPLIDESALSKVESLLKNAVDSGANIVTGGKKHALGGLFFEPTVVVGVKPTMRLASEEIFGPISAIYEFETEDQAIAIANDTPYGLSAYFFTMDYRRIFRVSNALDYGMVGANESVLSSEMAPFGGVKESGLGREGSHLGIEEYLTVKYLCIGGLI
jgi:succinate-semialdehyde dehydrogenase/glutarate-semialdehyde dehydrogenase